MNRINPAIIALLCLSPILYALQPVQRERWQLIQNHIDATPKVDGVPIGKHPIGGRVAAGPGLIECRDSIRVSSSIILTGDGDGTLLRTTGSHPPIFLHSRATNGACINVTLEKLAIDGVDASCIMPDETATMIDTLTLRDVTLAGKDTHIALGDNRVHQVSLDHVQASRVGFGGIRGNVAMLTIGANTKFLREHHKGDSDPIIYNVGPQTQTTIQAGAQIEGTGVLVHVEGVAGYPAELHLPAGKWIEPHGNGPQIIAKHAVVVAESFWFCSPEHPVQLTDCDVYLTRVPASGLQMTRCKLNGKDAAQ